MTLRRTAPPAPLSTSDLDEPRAPRNPRDRSPAPGAPPRALGRGVIRSYNLLRVSGPIPSTILVTEDDDDLRELVVMLLEEEGFLVETARHGREALQRVQQHMPDLILLDMKMPVMDGWAFAAELRARHDHRAPIVVMTAAEHASARAQEIGADGWLSKPFEHDDLIAMVKTHLRP